MKDYFSILGVPRYANEEEIKEAYRKLAMRWHPDLNFGDEESEKKMQDLNRAKEVLFDKETRDDYKRLLDVQDRMTLDSIRNYKKKNKQEKQYKTVDIEKKYPFDRTKVILSLIGIIAVIGAALFFALRAHQDRIETSNPIGDIVKRHLTSERPIGTVEPNQRIPNQSIDAIERMATLSAMLGDYKTAISYWRFVLDSGKYHLSTVTNVALAFIKINNYAEAMATVSQYAVTKHDQLIVYSLLGDYFKSSAQIFDAEDAYKAALAVSPNLDSTDAATEEAILRAKAGVFSH